MPAPLSTGPVIDRAMISEDPAPAELVAGKYQLQRLLGRGGMGSVWEGVHVSLGTRVAVKFIEAEYADSPEARARFVNEARAAATLQSKHVVQVYDHGLMPDGRPYIVMEFLAGEPLDARLDRQGRLKPAETVRIVQQIARALGKAHRAGIVHRDLKPENVFLVWDDDEQTDVAKVVDFGIAKFTSPSMGVSSSTRTGSVLGTPYFMSPEQARGLRSVDYRTDLWALGVITYRCLVGALPFTGEAVGDLLVKICTAPLPVPSQLVPELPAAFDAWFARALAREPEGRFQSAQELAEALVVALGAPRGEQISALDLIAVGGAAPPGAGGLAPGALLTPGGGVGFATPPGQQYGGNPAAGAGAVPTPGHPLQLEPSGTHPRFVADVQTAAPFMQTPPAGVPRQGRAGLIALFALLGVLLLGGALSVGLFLFRGAPGVVADETAVESALAASADPAAGPSVLPAVAVAPAPPAAPSAEPIASAAPPASASAGSPAGPVAITRVSPRQPIAVRPSASPATAGGAAPPVRPRPRPVTDVGY